MRGRASAATERGAGRARWLDSAVLFSAIRARKDGRGSLAHQSMAPGGRRGPGHPQAGEREGRRQSVAARPCLATGLPLTIHAAPFMFPLP